MRRFANLAFVSLLLTACTAQPHTTPQSTKENKADQITNRISYTKDNRTGVCFAILSGFAHTNVGVINKEITGITNVPCEKIPTEMLR